MDYEFAGLPLHVLIVHLVVVAVPLVSLLLVVVAAWPAARRVLWIPVAAAALLLIPLALVTIEAGEWLEARVPDAPLIDAHTSLGESLVPWMWALAIVGLLIAAWALVERAARRRAARAGVGADGVPVDARGDARGGARPIGRGTTVAVGALLTVLAVVAGAGATWTLVQIGESGSRAVWEGSFSDEPVD